MIKFNKLDNKMLSKNCKQCGKSFFKRTVTSMRIWREKRKFCSNICQITFILTDPIIRKKANETKSKLLKGKKTIQIQRMVEVNRNRIYSKQQRENISEALKLAFKEGRHSVAMEKNPCWKGGKSFEEYGKEFDNALKEQIRFRDNYKCRKCGCTQIENGRQLDVHHIDYDKKNNIYINLLSLCVPCHRTTVSNREYWKKYYQDKVKTELLTRR